MALRIDKAGRLVLAKPLRDRPDIRQDSELEAIEQPEGVLLRRIADRPSLVMADGLWVHQGNPDRGAGWDRGVEEVREDRIDATL